MSTAKGRSKPLESAVSICILLVLLAIAAAIFIKQLGVSVNTVAIQTTGMSQSQVSFELNSLAPDGFEVFSKRETYTPETLYEKINGKSPLYLEAGFEQLSAQRFANKTDEALIMEIFVYDMGSARNAFSVYSTQKRADTEILSTARFGYKTSNGIYLAHGRYYIELVGFSEAKELLEAITATAEKIQDAFAVGSDAEMNELNLFPPENITPGSAKLHTVSAFGFEGFSNVFTCRYELDAQSVTAFLSKRPSPEEAQTFADSYYKFLIDNGAEPKQPINEDLDGKVIDFYDSIEVIFASGPFVAGVHDAQDQPTAENIALRLLHKLK